MVLGFDISKGEGGLGKLKLEVVTELCLTSIHKLSSVIVVCG